MEETVCEICGNEPGPGAKVCPFCGAELAGQSQLVRSAKSVRHKTVNLELGRPVAEIAVKKMESELSHAVLEGVTSMTFIHGYGSSGKGGVIRKECRKMLFYMQDRGLVAEVIPGETFSSRDKKVKQLLRQWPELMANTNLNRRNRGITIVLMKKG